MNKEVKTALSTVMASPLMPRYVDELQQIWTDECARRERFYEEMTEQQKVEFINGKVVMHSPARIRHINAVGYLYRLLSQHVDSRDLGWAGYEKNLVCLSRNDYEPDVTFFGREKAAMLRPEQMKLPAPDFIAETLSPSTEGNDRGVKFEDYATHGVLEYWIVDPVAETIEQYTLDELAPSPRYHSLGIWTGDAEVTSVAVPGFHLPARALFERQANLAALAALS